MNATPPPLTLTEKEEGLEDTPVEKKMKGSMLPTRGTKESENIFKQEKKRKGKEGRLEEIELKRR